jgi:D-glycerate 3-kinase
MAGRDDYIHKLLLQESLPDDFLDTVNRYYRPLAGAIAHRSANHSGPLVVGVNGAQGTGKSTLATFLAAILDYEFNLGVAAFSVDDIYLTRARRQQLALEIHPMLAVRGVPGTHDVALGLATFQALAGAGPETTTPLPSFDKGIDDRKPVEQWSVYSGRPDIIILEGWCVGAVPQQDEALLTPVNELEAQQDGDGQWRRYVNDQLAGPYARLFSQLDMLVMIRAPGWSQVYEWRLLQEEKLRQRCREQGLDDSQVMSPDQVRAFISYYHRLTLHQLAEMPQRADVVLAMDENHHITAISSLTNGSVREYAGRCNNQF